MSVSSFSLLQLNSSFSSLPPHFTSIAGCVVPTPSDIHFFHGTLEVPQTPFYRSGYLPGPYFPTSSPPFCSSQKVTIFFCSSSLGLVTWRKSNIVYASYYSIQASSCSSHPSLRQLSALVPPPFFMPTYLTSLTLVYHIPVLNS